MAEHGNAMMRYALRLTQDQHLAEDVVQETLTRAWLHRDSVREERGSVRGWLLSVLRNLVIDQVRAKAARPREVTEDRCPHPLVDDASDRVVAAATLRSVWWRLSEDHRRVLYELYFADRSVGEVSALLGVPAGTVKSRTHYAMRQLRTLLGHL